MKKLAVLLVGIVLQLAAVSQTHPAARPRILGIDRVSFYTTAPSDCVRPGAQSCRFTLSISSCSVNVPGLSADGDRILQPF